MSGAFSSCPSQRSRCVILACFMILLAVLVFPLLPCVTAGEAANEDTSPVLQEEMMLGDGGFSMSLQLLDPETWEPRRTFFFGDEVGYQASLSIPAAAEGKKATVKLTATVMLGVVAFPFTTSHVFTGPVTNPTDKEDEIYKPKVWQGKFEIPSDIPVSQVTANVKLVATIADIGTSTITQKITLKTRQKLSKPVLKYPSEGQSFGGWSCAASSYSAYWSFNWEEVPGAAKYEISIRNKTDNTIITYETEKKYYGGTSPCKLSKPQEWAWKVRAGNQYCWSAWSVERSFTITGN